jgi:hypothetical protein
MFINFDKDNISDKMLAETGKFLSNPDTAPEVVMGKSAAAASFA